MAGAHGCSLSYTRWTFLFLGYINNLLFSLLNLIMSEMLRIHVCHAMSKLKPWSEAMAASRLAESERNLNVNYGSKKSNRLNVESQRFWENPIVIHGDLKYSSSQTAQTTASRRPTSVQLCVCMLYVCVCLHLGQGTRGGNYR